MGLILQIALGIVLGFVMLAYMREILALGFLLAALVVAGAVLVVGCVGFYYAYTAAREAAAASPFLQGLSSALAPVAALFAHVLFGFAVGTVVESNSSLRGREAYIFGFIFFEGFIGSVLAGAWAIAQSIDGDINGSLTLAGLAAAWVTLIAVFWIRNRASKGRGQDGIQNAA